MDPAAFAGSALGADEQVKISAGNSIRAAAGYFKVCMCTNEKYPPLAGLFLFFLCLELNRITHLGRAGWEKMRGTFLNELS